MSSQLWVFAWICHILIINFNTKLISGTGSIKFSDNAYTNVVVTIRENESEDPNLVPKIKEFLTDGSAILYAATRKRAYIKEVKIVVPSSWTRKSEYEDPGNLDIKNSDIFIDSMGSAGVIADTPNVCRHKTCGVYNGYMHLTTRFLLDDNIGIVRYGPRGKTFVHEWAHLRYGVFDEYPRNDRRFYNDVNGNVEAIGCSKAIEYVTYYRDNAGDKTYGCPSNGGSLPHPNCHVSDFRNATTLDYASFMYKQFLPHIHEFCDNDTTTPKSFHNRDAPNNQNKRCGMRSVWEVLREHADFKDGINPPKDGLDTTPSFRVCQFSGNSTYVLVLDKSSSMQGSRIQNLGTASSNFINSHIRDGDKLGIVTFDSTAARVAELTTIDDTTRATLVGHIPTGTGGSTSIAAGLLQALAMLEDGGGTSGAVIIVVTDGEETLQPFISSIEQTVLDANATVHAIAFTNNADNDIDDLAQLTGGSSFFFTNLASSNGLNEAFADIAQGNQPQVNQMITLISTSLNLGGGEELVDNVVIDADLGRDTEFIIEFTSTEVQVNLLSPSGVQYDLNSTQASRDPSFKVFRLKFPGLSVSPVLNMNVTVTIEDSSRFNQPVILFPKDDGAGADTNPSDGIYSAFFATFSINGRYNMRVEVVNTPSSLVGIGRIICRGTADILDPEYDTSLDVPIGDIQRAASGGSFRLVEYPRGGPTPADRYPPGMIFDLEVTNVDIPNLRVTLTWTALGNELDVGTVSEYEMRFNRSSSDLMDNFQSQMRATPDIVVQGNLTDPKPSGSREMVVVRVPSSGPFTYVFALKSKDLDGRVAESEISNLAQAGMQVFTSTETNIPFIPPGSGGGGGGGGSHLFPIILGSLTVVFLILLLVCVLHVRSWIKYRPRQPQQPQLPSTGVNNFAMV